MVYFIFSSKTIVNSSIKHIYATWKKMVIMYFKTISPLKRVPFGKFKFSMKGNIFLSFIRKVAETSKNRIISYLVVLYFL